MLSFDQFPNTAAARPAIHTLAVVVRLCEGSGLTGRLGTPCRFWVA
jgi:hypothetical protein